MKRHFLILAILLSGFAARAGVVDPVRARAVASGFFGGASVEPASLGEADVSGNGGSRVAGGGNVRAAAGGNAGRQEASSPEYYVFDNPSGGWVMISGEDSLNPVLAYSHSGRFHTDALPSNLSWWMDGIKAGVAYARKTGRTAGKEVRRAWEDAGLPGKSAGREIYMETATWNQGSPYNFYCPEVTEKPEGSAESRIFTSLTGCGATAIAIILQYNGYPAHGFGTLPSYSYMSDYKIPMDITGFDISSHSYKYDQMPLTDEEIKSAGSAAQQQVARLMFDVGVAIKSQFNYTHGTSSSSLNIIPALVGYFGYDASAIDLNRDCYSPGDWIGLLKNELDLERPLLYSGTGDAGGHMFVLAGYDQNDFFYVNWGWSGRNNGYFSIRDLFIDEKYAFGQSQMAYTGLVPSQGGQAEHVILLYGEGISIISGAPVQGADFKISVRSFLNDSLNDYDGCVRAALVDCNDNLKSYAGAEEAVSIPRGSSSAIRSVDLDDYTCNVSEPMLFGDGIVMFYQTNLGNWKICPYDHESGKLTRYGAYDACAIKLPDDISAGDVIAPSVIPGQKAIDKVEWFLDGNPVTIGQTERLMAGVHTIKAVVSFVSGGTETIVQEIIAK